MRSPALFELGVQLLRPAVALLQLVLSARRNSSSDERARCVSQPFAWSASSLLEQLDVQLALAQHVGGLRNVDERSSAPAAGRREHSADKEVRVFGGAAAAIDRDFGRPETYRG